MEWQRDTSGECPDEHMGSATVSGGSERSYDITDLFGDSSYSIRVSAMNAAGSVISEPLVVSTAEAGISLLNYVCNVLSHAILSPLPQIPQLHPLVYPHPVSLQTVSVFSGGGCLVSTAMETSQATLYWYRGMGACRV